ncbi:hypothetical protein [Sphingomonas solaris]|uniref:Phytoene synthase n=1 Tax=Alterirhizorhabdus solaris TaxID=2529389 RepID=A0A558QWT9_9SPHN|nr:hypothetical protein [Sphingomonas solaris]TVV71568.1 hypothetical protein FOY91_16565 [Sphingomonas solaris]
MADDTLRDPELSLSLAYAPAARRPALAALWRLDERLAAIVVEPNRPITAIKLAWWREALERLDQAPPPPEPLLAALGEAVAAGVSGARLAGLAAAWDVLIDDDAAEDEGARIVRHARERAAALFGTAADLLGGAGQVDVAVAGQSWSLATVPVPLAAGRREAAASVLSHVPPGYWPRRLRALGVLAVLGRERLHDPAGLPGSPRRIVRALWHAASGL